MKFYQIVLFLFISAFYQKTIAQSEKILFEGVKLDKSVFLEKQQINSIPNTVNDSIFQKFAGTLSNTGTVINFDEQSAPCLFVEQTLPTNIYFQQGLTFSGTWKILNSCGIFSVNNFSVPNFLAWNTEVTSRVESLIFTSPVKNVSFGMASNYSFILNIKLFNANNEIIENINTSISGILSYINFTQENISKIEITVGSNSAGILDNLSFTKQCPTGNLTLLSPNDDYYNGNATKKGNTIFASNLIQGNNTNVIYVAEKSITLTPGFYIHSGAIFKAEIRNCN